MIGRQIVSQFRLGFWMCLFALITAVLAAVAIIQRNPHLAIAALLPAALAMQAYRAGSIGFAGTVTAEALVLEDSGETIPYADIEALSLDGVARSPDDAALRSGHLHVVHRQGGAIIPRRINVPTADLYRFLVDQVPITTAKPPAALHDHFYEQQHQFGVDRVFAFSARSQLRPKAARGLTRYFGPAILLVGICWIAVPLILLLLHETLKLPEPPEDYFGWIVGGAIAVFVGLLTWVSSPNAHSNVERRVKGWQHASLVVSPIGIALVQGDLRGQLRWDELLEIRSPRGWVFGQQPAAGGLQLVVAGATIVVEDIYNRPLATIERLLRRYWRPA